MSLDKAIECARMLPIVKGQKRHYAIITDSKGRIIAEGQNSYSKTSPVMARAAKKAGFPDKIFCHAEQIALVRSRGKGVKLYVARVNAKGEPMPSAPCPVCSILIKEHKGIYSVEYTV